MKTLIIYKIPESLKQGSAPDFFGMESQNIMILSEELKKGLRNSMTQDRIKFITITSNVNSPLSVFKQNRVYMKLNFRTIFSTTLKIADIGKLFCLQKSTIKFLILPIDYVKWAEC
ncbi:hypothetical protein BpHYR1_041310 [Brachionus plicatilis]|uniref:Uncharacterized protein n=1 Tax=Brachionus plicatilis TaxID=10195 RepID=A0A3M7R5N4_BRAPC|nr:hypothetical protein BpHYR1_041310 [Brachionus plicatilis]